MAERAAAHEDRNLARMLTPAERKDKKLRKLVGEEQPETHVALYKVLALGSGQIIGAGGR
jgi:U4/U6 small nuclear ribonucleoprotein PRP3